MQMRRRARGCGRYLGKVASAPRGRGGGERTRANVLSRFLSRARAPLPLAGPARRNLLRRHVTRAYTPAAEEEGGRGTPVSVVSGERRVASRCAHSPRFSSSKPPKIPRSLIAGRGGGQGRNPREEIKCRHVGHGDVRLARSCRSERRAGERVV